MSLFITSLNSGSNANCYYIGNEREAVLIDAGLSCRETEKRMKRLGLEVSRIKALFISHEHSDHITGIPALSKKYQLPVYITPATFENAGIPIEPHLVRSFDAQKPVKFDSLTIKAFVKSHDASDPHSFIVSDGKVNIGVFTDLGYSCKETIRHFKQCHAVFLESNYCENMLENGNYPLHLKRRISSKKGHLSNAQALELFIKHRPRQLTHLILSHLSKNNNDPVLVDKLFNAKAGQVSIVVASRYNETPVYHIQTSMKAKRVLASVEQLSLFN